MRGGFARAQRRLLRTGFAVALAASTGGLAAAEPDEAPPEGTPVAVAAAADPTDPQGPSAPSRRGNLAMPTDAPTHQVEPISVRAQGREEPLEKVPISITAFSERQIEENQIEELADYFRLTPNVNFSTNGNRGRTQVSIRGVGNIGGRSNAFGIYVDGLNIAPSSSIRTFDPNLLDIERIEVLRGPQGTFFGRNSTAGAISITSIKPGPEPYASLEGDYGRFNSYLGRGVVNIPVIEDVLMVRAAGYYETDDGWIDNVGPAGGDSGVDAWGARLAIRTRPFESMTIDSSLRYSDYDQGVNNYVIRDDDLGVPPPPWEVDTDFRESTSIESWIATNAATLEFDHFNLTSVTGFIKNDYLEFNDRDQSPVPLRTQLNRSRLRSLSQELRLDTTLFDQLFLIVGGMYSRDELKTDARLDADLPPTTIGFQDLDQLEVTKSWAGFADFVWRLHPMIDLTLGGRYTDVVYDRDDQFTDDTRFTFFGTTTILFSQDEASGRVSDDDLSYRAILTIRWTEDVLTYLSHSTGFKNGGSNGVRADEDFGSERIKAYELGYKLWLLDGRLRATGAFFYYDWEDLQVFAIDPVGTTVFVQNAARARTKGAELELSAVPLPGLEITAGVGYLDAEFRDFIDDTGADLSGATVPFAPRWTVNATTQYTFALPFHIPGLGETDFFLRGEWSWVDESLRDVDASAGDETFVISQYQVANLRIGLESDQLRIVGYVENLFDNDYFTGIRTSFLGPGNPNRVDPNPRIYGVRVKATF